MNKKMYADFSRTATASNDINRNLAQFQAHIEFLRRTNNVSELESLNARFASFLDVVKAEFIATLPDEPITQSDRE